MGKKCLILYASYTGNTEKVALRMKSTFEKNGWECDIFKVRKTAEDILNPPYNIADYDFLCVGSGVRVHLPYNEILNVLWRFILGRDPRIVLRHRDETIPYIHEPAPEMPSIYDEPHAADAHRKMVLGPDAKNGIVFVTYSGAEFGPEEAEPSLQLLALEMKHLNVRCVGRFCCPGRFLFDPMPRAYHGDIRNRPDERDLLKAEMFIEEMLEAITDRTQ